MAQLICCIHSGARNCVGIIVIPLKNLPKDVKEREKALMEWVLEEPPIAFQ